MRASQRNDAMHEIGLASDQVALRYSSWAKAYETDLCPENFRGPSIIADRMHELFPDVTARAHLRIVDVAAGTGLVGQKLHPMGFAQIDAVEPSEGMLEVLKEKHIYTQTFANFLDGHILPMATDTYDAAVISGGMGEGHIPCKGLEELARIVKPGGVVVIVMREAYLHTVAQYKDRLEPHMSHLESTGIWQLVSREIVPRYSFSNDGVLFTFRVK